jgi:hypothetical protein
MFKKGDPKPLGRGRKKGQVTKPKQLNSRATSLQGHRANRGSVEAYASAVTKGPGQDLDGNPVLCPTQTTRGRSKPPSPVHAGRPTTTSRLAEGNRGRRTQPAIRL